MSLYVPSRNTQKDYLMTNIGVKENLLFLNRLHICNGISVRYSSLVKSSMGFLREMFESGKVLYLQKMLQLSKVL